MASGFFAWNLCDPEAMSPCQLIPTKGSMCRAGVCGCWELVTDLWHSESEAKAALGLHALGNIHISWSRLWTGCHDMSKVEPPESCTVGSTHLADSVSSQKGSEIQPLHPISTSH